MNKFESTITLSSLLKRCPVIYIEHDRDAKHSYGRFYTITKNELRHITFDVAMCLDMYSEDYITDVYNRKNMKAEKCLKSLRPETLVRNLSEELYDRWDIVKFYSLDYERIF